MGHAGRGRGGDRFGDASKTRMAKWAQKHLGDHLDAAIVDLGSGNGHLVFELVWRGGGPEGVVRGLAHAA